MATVIAVLGSTGLFTLIQFLIKRHDEKKGVLSTIKEELASLKKSIDDLNTTRNRDKADNARRRILAATDELRTGITIHTQEWYNQLNDDVDDYEHYCNKDKDYANTKAVSAIEYFKKNYAKRLEQNDFL